MKVFCGTDIIEVDRIKNAIENFEGQKFLNKIYTEKEIQYCNSKGINKYQHFAARFAAKEAVYKALADQTENNISLKNIEIQNMETGKPIVVINKNKIDNIQNIDISLSHVKEYAVANCIVTIE